MTVYIEAKDLARDEDPMSAFRWDEHGVWRAVFLLYSGDLLKARMSPCGWTWKKPVPDPAVATRLFVELVAMPRRRDGESAMRRTYITEASPRAIAEKAARIADECRDSAEARELMAEIGDDIDA